MTLLLERPDLADEPLLPTVDDATRREFVAGSALAALLVACGNADGDGSPGGTEAGDSFPMTINGAFGRTRIDRKPERIAAVGFLRDGDDALALGVTPVAMTANDLFPESFAPWTLEALGAAGTTVLNAPEGLLPFERIAAAQPDLILATDDRTLADHHDRLAGIAPTLAYTIGAEAEPWRLRAERIGQALGRSQQGTEVTRRIEQRSARRDSSTLSSRARHA